MNYSTKNKLQKVTSVILPIIGIFIMLAFIAIVWFWESYGRERYLYTNVIVASEDIKEGTVINKDMLGLAKVEKSKVISGVMEDPDKIIGKASRHFIPKLSQMHESFLITKELVMDKDHFITPLPKEWIKAVPNSLRRQDTAYICFVNSELFNNSDTPEKENKVILAPGGNTIQTYNADQGKNILVAAGTPEIKTVIAYVKDGANREVVTLSKEERYDGTAAISEINVNLTREEFKTIEEQIAKGSRIVIKYKENEDLEETEVAK